MQEARAYGKKNLLISFDFESFLNYVSCLMDVIEHVFHAKEAFG
jgi:hypothetical protein